MPSPAVPSVVKWGSDIPLSLTTDDQQSSPQLAGLAGGGFAASWTEGPFDGGDGIIHVQVFNADGTRRGSEHAFLTHSLLGGSDHAIVGLTDGSFELAWSQYARTGNDTIFNIMTQEFTRDGQAV